MKIKSTMKKWRTRKSICSIWLCLGGVHELRWQDEVSWWYWKCQLYPDYQYFLLVVDLGIAIIKAKPNILQKILFHLFFFKISCIVKLTYFEKVTKFCGISTIDLTITVHRTNPQWRFCKIGWPSQNMNFNMGIVSGDF